MVSHLPPEKTENKHLFTSTVACSKTKTTIATRNNQPVQSAKEVALFGASCHSKKYSGSGWH